MTDSSIAIIGLGGRFPKSPDVPSLWRNLCNGADLSTTLDVDGTRVNRGYPLDDVGRFDARFFGISPTEALNLDPQHRIALETAAQVLEGAGYGGEADGDAVGVFMSCAFNGYLHYLFDHSEPENTARYFEMLSAGDKDYLATRLSYKLGLSGPSISVQTACSSSLVAVTLACQSLLDLQCDMALAGGVCVRVPDRKGYTYEEGGALSPDGLCRPYNAKAAGTAGGNGCGIVLLKRLEDALADGDHISAVIRSYAINNDGSAKAGFTAPAVEGQKQVIAEALAMAEIDPATICYVEGHGTATPLGDPIEVQALNAAYGSRREVPCRLGSIKGNIGHLDTAAGVAGLIKVAKILETGITPPTMHFEHASLAIPFADGPFQVSGEVGQLPSISVGDGVKRAGLSSFGFGGTNVHMILEEAPAIETPRVEAPVGAVPLMLSALTTTALQRRASNILEDLEHLDEGDLPALANTLQIGRKALPARAARAVSTLDEARTFAQEIADHATCTLVQSRPHCVFVLPGQGSQYPGAAAELYKVDTTFRARLDECLALASQHTDIDLRAALLSPEFSAERLADTVYAQLSIFSLQIAMAAALEARGILPESLIGHSVGEWTAAALSGVMSLEDALYGLLQRAQSMALQPEGDMLAVSVGAARLAPMLEGTGLCIAAINAPNRLTVSGQSNEVSELAERLQSDDISATRLATSHAFHSAMMEAASARFTEKLQDIALNPPRIRWISNVTGRAITPEQATSPEYWGNHIRQPVLFAQGLAGLEAAHKDALFIEIGPGRTLQGILRNTLRTTPSERIIACDSTDLNNTLAAIWTAGVEIDQTDGPALNRLNLTPYTFEGDVYWPETRNVGISAEKELTRQAFDQWFYTPQWHDLRQPLDAADPRVAAHWNGALVHIVGDGSGALSARLETLQARLIETPQDADHIFIFSADDTDKDESFIRLISLLQSFDGTEQGPAVHLVRSGLQGSAALGALKAASLEYPGLTFSAFNVPAETYETLACDPLVLGLEDRTGGALPDTRYAMGRRYCLDYASLSTDIDAPTIFRDGGTYLIFGGLSGIGLEFARSAAKVANVRLALTTRSALPENLDTSVQSDRLLAAREIKALLGERVLFSECRLEDPASVHACLGAARTFGDGIDGIVHSAGVPGGGLIATGLPKGALSNFGPKVEGLRTLSELIKDEALDFMILNSSLGSVQGVVGQADNCAANQVMDDMARHGLTGAARVISINWDRWRDVGMAVKAEARHRELTGQDFHAYMSAEEGMRAVNRALASGHNQIVVSTLDLHAETRRLRAQQTTGIESLSRRSSDDRVARPELASSFAAPRDDVEKILAGLMAKNLGFERIGVFDGYTDLGGDSLLAISLSKTVNETFRTRLPLSALFNAQTVAGIAEALRTHETSPGLIDRVAKARMQISTMSKEEKASLVEEAAQGASFTKETAA